MTFRWVLGCCLLACCLSFDYNSQHTLKCSTIDDSWTLEENLQYLW